MAIGAFHFQEAQCPLAVMTMCFHRVATQFSLRCAQVVVKGMKNSTTGKTRNATRKRAWDFRSNALSSPAAFSSRERGGKSLLQCGQDAVGNAKTTETSWKTHFAYRFLVFVRSFMLIALDESFQDWLRVEGRTGVHFQHAAHDQLIGVERRL